MSERVEALVALLNHHNQEIDRLHDLWLAGAMGATRPETLDKLWDEGNRHKAERDRILNQLRLIASQPQS